MSHLFRNLLCDLYIRLGNAKQEQIDISLLMVRPGLGRERKEKENLELTIKLQKTQEEFCS